MTDSPSDDAATPQDDTPDDDTPAFAAELAGLVGATEWSADHATVRIIVDASQWVEALTTASTKGGLPFFSWLSAVDWSKDVSVGEAVADVDDLDERFEVVCRLSSLSSARGAHFIARLDRDQPTIDSLVSVFCGAAWHEREAAEMFGIHFEGHPHLVNLYLPDAFEGHPMRKSFALLAREVKPWPGTVDVEDMPTTENTEAAAMEESAP